MTKDGNTRDPDVSRRDRPGECSVDLKEFVKDRDNSMLRALPIGVGPWPSHIQIPCSLLISNHWETKIGHSKANPSASEFSVLRHRMGPLYRKQRGRKCIQIARRWSPDLSDLPFDPGDIQVARPGNDTLAPVCFLSGGNYFSMHTR
jgi:hypothetical protein